VSGGSIDRPTVSIITPSFNQGRFLAAAIESVLAQDYPAIEYYVVDAGSTDETHEVLGAYGDRIRWISEPDAGQADGIDKGIRSTSGEIVAWLNADDLYLPGAVMTAVAALEKDSSAAGVYGNAEFVDFDGRPIGPCTQVEEFDLGRLINVLDFIVQPATFFRRTVYEAAGGLDRSLHYCLDYDLWIRLGQRAPLRYVTDTLAQVRLHPETKTASGGLPRLLEIERMIRRHGRDVLPVDFQREMFHSSADALGAAVQAGQWADVARLASTVVRYGSRVAGRRIWRDVTGRG
jgi:glycosyltransferase involved in cell wall biosynthesis